MRSKSVAAALVAVAASSIALLPGTPVSAATLPIGSFTDVLVDQAHGHVFVSGSTLAVANLDGVITTSAVAGVSGVRSLAMSADGSELYVAANDGITVVNPVTLNVVTTLSTGAGSCPVDMAPSSGKIFFGYGCSGLGNLGAVDRASGTVTPSVVTHTWLAPPRLESVPSQPSMLVASDNDTIIVLDTTGGATPTATIRATANGGDNLQDFALTPAGDKVVTAAGGTYHHQILNTSDGSLAGTYGSQLPYPNAVAIRADGMVAAGIDASSDPDVYFYPNGSVLASSTVDFGVVGSPGSPNALEARGLAFGTKRLYAVTTDVYGDYPTLRVLSAGPPAKLAVSTSASSYKYGAKAIVTVKLLSPTVSKVVALYQTPSGGSTTLVKQGKVDAYGNLTASVVVTRRTTFTARTSADDDFSAGSATRVVTVGSRTSVKPLGAKARSGAYFVYQPNAHPWVLATVLAKQSTGCVRFTGQRYAGGRWATFDTSSCLPLSAGRSSARLLGSYPRGIKVRVRATFTGSTLSKASTSRWAYVTFR